MAKRMLHRQEWKWGNVLATQQTIYLHIYLVFYVARYFVNSKITLFELVSVNGTTARSNWYAMAIILGQ